MALTNLLSQPPVFPDFCFCHEAFNDPERGSPSLGGCRQAYQTMAKYSRSPRHELKEYTNMAEPWVGYSPTTLPQWFRWDSEESNLQASNDDDTNSSYSDATVSTSGSGWAPGWSDDDLCDISVQLIDPEQCTNYYRRGRRNREISVVPNDLLEMSGWVYNECIEGHKTAGFVTRNISHAINYLRDTEDEWWVGTQGGAVWPAEALFFSVGMGTHRRFFENAGYQDPMVGGRIFTSLHRELANTPRNSPDFARLDNTARRIGYFFSKMRRGINTGDRIWSQEL